MLEFTKEKPFNLLCGDSYEVLKTLPDNSIDSIVTDPPYGLSKQPDLNEVLKHWLNDEKYISNSKGFMGKSWDSFVPSPILWKEAFRVLKPGGHILCFAGTRTQHLMAMSLGLAGFEIRDQIIWCYGSGFPKSLNISKAIDKIQGNQREIVGRNKNSRENCDKSNTLYESGTVGKTDNITKSTSPDGIKYEGFGSAIKPAHEPITLARKPMAEKNTALNVLKHGTGGLNIDGCRIGDSGSRTNANKAKDSDVNSMFGNTKLTETVIKNQGRFPSNFIVEENDLNLDILEDKMKYFYSPKCSKVDRNEGLDDFEDKKGGFVFDGNDDNRIKTGSGKSRNTMTKNTHPTVKPTELMAYLCRLITPKGGIILDPFNGSGSTGKAAMREGFNYIGVDLDQDYIDISKARIEFELNKRKY